MTRDQDGSCRRAAQSLSRAGLLWLALTAVTLGSLVSSATGLVPIARWVAASTIGAGKLKANGPEAPSLVRGALAHRALRPDGEAKRIHTGGAPLGLVVADLALDGSASAYKPTLQTDVDRPSVKPSAFSARAPPA